MKLMISVGGPLPSAYGQSVTLHISAASEGAGGVAKWGRAGDEDITGVSPSNDGSVCRRGSVYS